MKPIIKIELSRTEKLLISISNIILLGICFIAIYSYFKLPDSIPIHFNLQGEVDGYGNKSSIFFIPIITILLILMLRWVAKNPHLFNYPVKITKENYKAQYQNAVLMMHVLRFVISITFLIIIIETIWTSHNQSTFMSRWLVPFLIALIFVPLIYFIFKSYKIK